LGLGSVDGDTLRCDLVLQIAEDRRIDSAAGQVGLKLVETGGVACYLVGKPGDGAFGGGQAHALGGHVGADLLHCVAQRLDVSLRKGKSGVDVSVKDVEQAAYHEGGLVTREGFVTAEGAVGETDDD